MGREIDIREDENFQEYLVRKDRELMDIMNSGERYDREEVFEAMIAAEDAFILNEVTKKLDLEKTKVK